MTLYVGNLQEPLHSQDEVDIIGREPQSLQDNDDGDQAPLSYTCCSNGCQGGCHTTVQHRLIRVTKGKQGSGVVS